MLGLGLFIAKTCLHALFRVVVLVGVYDLDVVLVGWRVFGTFLRSWLSICVFFVLLLLDHLVVVFLFFLLEKLFIRLHEGTLEVNSHRKGINKEETKD